MKELKEFTVEMLEQYSAITSWELLHSNVNLSDLRALAKIALAAKQVEPAAYMYRDNLHSDARFSLESKISNWSSEDISEYEVAEIPLYTTPPLNHTKQDGWIKCSDQLPPDDDFVLVWPTPDFGVDLHVGQYMKYHKKGAGWFAQVNEQNYGIEWHPIAVTHWMKLPASPKPEM